MFTECTEPQNVLNCVIWWKKKSNQVGGKGPESQAKESETSHSHFWESHKNTKLHNHNIDAEDHRKPMQVTWQLLQTL